MNYKILVFVLFVIALWGCDIYEYECESNTWKCSKNRVMSCNYEDTGSFWTKEIDCDFTQTECLEYKVAADGENLLKAACVVPDADCELDGDTFCFNDKDLGYCTRLGEQNFFTVSEFCRRHEQYCIIAEDGNAVCGSANEM